jgi:hypothetical protein
MITLALMYELHKYKIEKSLAEKEKELKGLLNYKKGLIAEVKKEVKAGNLDNGTADVIIGGDKYKVPRIITMYDKSLIRINNDIREVLKGEKILTNKIKVLDKLRVNKDIFNFVIKEHNKSFIDNVINNEETDIIKDIGLFKTLYYNKVSKSVNWGESMAKKKELIEAQVDFTWEDYISYFPDQRIYLKYLYPKSFYGRIPSITGYKFIAYKSVLLKLVNKMLSLDEQTFKEKFKL